MNLMPGVMRGCCRSGDSVLSAVQADGPGGRRSAEHLRLHTSNRQVVRRRRRLHFVEPLGSHVLVTALVGETRVIVQAPADVALDAGARIGPGGAARRTYFFDAVTGEAQRSRERITLS